MISIIKKLLNYIQFRTIVFLKIDKIQSDLLRLREGLARVETRQLELASTTELQANEFRAFSQWGEDGIIQFLIKHTPIDNKIFVEFGVENYLESNTRFLLINNNWSGLVIDGNIENINYIIRDPIYWQHNLKAVQGFVNQENINDILVANGLNGDIGLLSIDIDGNDYWVWKSIDVINPRIVIIEYNANFGNDKAVTIPYDPFFKRSTAHYSMIYAGSSLKALCLLGNQKGYAFVGCNSAGNNAFFLRRDIKPDFIRELTPSEGYVASQFRESRDSEGKLTYTSQSDVQALLNSLPLINTENLK